jgi:hypothetical protein
MGNTGIRVCGPRLRWKDVSTTRTLTGKVRAILSVRGKRGGLQQGGERHLIYRQRLSFFPEVPEHEVVAELFLPLK